MDPEQARSALTAERDRVQEQLGESRESQTEDHEDEAEVGDSADPARSLTEQGVDDAIATSLRDRLAAIDRALERVDAGTYGRSVRSGDPIPDDRLEADPAAELTVDEVAADEAADR
jgi:DnaK suppressor protein